MKMKTIFSKGPVCALAGAIFCTWAIGLSGCAGLKMSPQRGSEEIKPSAVLPVPGGRTGKGGAMLLVAEVKNVDGEARDFSCRWRVINQESSKSFFIDIKSAATAPIYLALDPGVYKTGRLGCGISKVWEIDDVFQQGFRVEDGSVSYIGKLIFEFKGNDLQTVRKASRAESAKSFAAAVDASPIKDQAVISGFTGRKIEAAMVASGVQEGFDVYAKGTKDANKVLEPLLVQLKSCAKDNSPADPLRFGRLEYTAMYKDGRFNEMTSRQDANGFSDQLRSCVERGMMAFHPGAKNEIEVRVRY
jgi:hypothetical protein